MNYEFQEEGVYSRGKSYAEYCADDVERGNQTPAEMRDNLKACKGGPLPMDVVEVCEKAKLKHYEASRWRHKQ
jgi:hypothetical protein